jgi:hypothetical protein
MNEAWYQGIMYTVLPPSSLCTAIVIGIQVIIFSTWHIYWMDPIIISSSAFYGITPFTYIVTRISFIPSALGGSLPWSLLPLDTFLLSPEIATHTPYTPTHVPSFVPSSSCLAPSPSCLPCLTPFLVYSGGGIPIHLGLYSTLFLAYLLFLPGCLYYLALCLFSF